MKIVNCIQGSPEWLAHRRTVRNASDAPAMLGVSPYKTRSQLVREQATGVTAEIDETTQRRFDDGHRFEAMARPLAEKLIGEELFPCVGVLEGTKYSASFDGLTMLLDTAFEHKSLNDAIRNAIDDGIGNGVCLPEYLRVQMEQQCMVSGAERVLFMATKWSGETLVEERHCWYYPDAELRKKIVNGWAQFDADVAAYVPEAETAPAPIGKAPETLPALHIAVTGKVTASNLDGFKSQAMAVLGSINRDLQTDDDFANAEQTVKWCSGVEARLASTKDAVLAQTADIEAVFRTIDDVSAETRRIRLDLERLVKAKKEEIRTKIVTDAMRAYEAHVADSKADAGAWTPLPPPDFALAIKGKRTLSSMRDAIDAVLAQGKIAANESARKIRAALVVLDEASAGHEHLFRDRTDFISKPAEDIRTIVAARISEHERAQDAKSEADATPAPQHVSTLKPTPGARALSMDTSAKLQLSQINACIAPLSITGCGLASLGFHPVEKTRAQLYAVSDFPAICDALIRVISKAAEVRPCDEGSQR